VRAEVNMKPRLAGLIGLCVVSVLAACTPAQQETMTIKSTIKQTIKDYAACSAPILADQKYTPLKAYIPFGGFADASVGQMENTEYPTQEDITLLSDLQNRIAPCQQNVVSALDGIPGNLGTPFETYYSDEDQGIVALSQGHITWGQFVQALYAAAIDQRQQVVVVFNQLDAQLQAENDVEAAQQAQAFQNFADYLQRQQAIEAANRPVTATCNQFGTQTACTSY